MMIPQLPTLIIALAVSSFPIANGGLFPKKSSVKHIDSKQFRAALETEQAFVTAFVAPWCGHCQRLVPELIRAADGLHPLVPVYAVDCEDAQNKPLCTEQGVKGFPTVKMYPRGTKLKPVDFEGTRSASSVFYWASGVVPFNLKRSQTAKGVQDIVRKNPGKTKAVLMNKSNKMPLLWKVLSNKFGDKIIFVNCRDRRGKESVELGFEAGEKKHKILIYGKHDAEPILYDGVLKFSILSDFFDQVLEGKIDVSRDAKQEVFKTPEAEDESDGLEDETAIDESGYGGFNPHDGVDLEELMKMTGGFNPHGDGHPGAGAKKPTPKKPNASKKATGSSSSSSSPLAATSSTSSSPVSSSTATPSSSSSPTSHEATDSRTAVAESALKDEL